ncbi:MAG: hypothetical protein JWM98_3228, partial [Thermoleophilia bacterium]|nr:hypothetical protein [Thermoleophilia bacterium]
GARGVAAAPAPAPAPDSQRATRATRAWIAGSVLVAILLRLPFLTTPLRLDEGGLALVGRAFVEAAGRADGSIYGGQWIDRPPLLIAVYGIAQVLAGAVGVRVLGTIGAVAIVALTARVTGTLGGRRAAPFACIVAVALTSSPALSGSFAYPEMLAAAVVTWVALRCLRTLGDAGHVPRDWFVIGLLGCAALLLKQSFLDGIAVGATTAVIAARRAGWRSTLAPFVAGVAAPVAAVLAWAVTLGPGVRALAYALFGFRIAAAQALRASSTLQVVRLHRLEGAAMDGGLPLLLPATLMGLVLVARRRGPAVAVVCGAWLAAGTAGVLGGGYYWGHYLLQLVPVLAVLAAIALAALPRPSLRAAALVGIVAVVAAGAAPGFRRHHIHAQQAYVTSVANAVSANRRAGDKLLVLHARANLAYYAGVRPATPYQWTLMYTAIPGAEQRLDELLASPRRPTWIVRWKPEQQLGLDRDGRARALITANYRLATVVCGTQVLLRADDGRELLPVPHPDGHACRA